MPPESEDKPKPEEKPGEKPAGDKSFSQAEVDRIIADRLRREREKIGDVDELKKAADELKALKDKDKSESEKLNGELAAEKATSAKTAAENRRLRVALAKAPEGISAADVLKYADRLRGDTQEQLEADAEEFFASFGSSTTSTKDGKPPASKPSERLKPGGAPEEEPDIDTDKVLEKIPRL